VTNHTDVLGKRHWTIHDVARRAEVSAKTVSRVINGIGGVGEETRARIIRIIREVGYHPHTGARSMRRQQRDCVGVAVTAPLSEVPIRMDLFEWLFAELYEIFGSKGSYICFDLNPFSASPVVDYGRGLWEQRCGGVVVFGPVKASDAVMRRIHDSGHPYLALNRPADLPNCSYATVDYEEGAYLSTRFLLDRGHTGVGMLQGFGDYQGGLERVQGYGRALGAVGLEVDPKRIIPVALGARDIESAVYRLLLDPGVTAIVDASSVEDAASIREGARRAGRTPGKDFEIVAWTYTDNAAVMAEAAAHVWLPLVEAASAGFREFADWFYGRRNGPVKILYRPTLYEAVAGAEVPKPRRLFDVFT